MLELIYIIFQEGNWLFASKFVKTWVDEMGIDELRVDEICSAPIFYPHFVYCCFCIKLLK